MRIPSQFTEDNLYHQQRGQVLQSYRRMIRMGLALVLVLVVINAASREAIYQPFFGSDFGSVPFEHRTVANEAAVLSETRANGNPMRQRGTNQDPFPLADASGYPKDATAKTKDGENRQGSLAGMPGQGTLIDAVTLRQDRRLASELSAELSVADQRLGARALIRWRANHESGPLPWGSLPSGPLRLRPFLSDASDTTNWRRVDAMIHALTVEAEKRVVDGAVWRGDDRDALRLRLEQSVFPSRNQEAAVVSVLSLLQQPEVFLGQPVRVVGRVARAQRISESRISESQSKKPVKDPLPDYWQLWLRPLRGADRPMVVLVPSVPEEIARVPMDALLDDGPPVMVQGTFFKRLAYRSSVGADLAPVIIGRCDHWPLKAIAGREQPQAVSIAASETLRSGRSRMNVALLLGAAIFLGVAAAGLVMWRTRQAARRTRQIRRLPDDLTWLIPQGKGARSSETNQGDVL